MKKRIVAELTALLLVFLLGTTWALAVSWQYAFPMTITDTSNVSRTYVPVLYTTGGQQLIDAGYDSGNGTNTNMQDGTTNVKYMLSTTKIATVVPSLPSAGQVTHTLYTGYLPCQSTFPIITGHNGYITTADNTTLELGSNGTMEWAGYHDLSVGTAKYYANKPDAISIANDEAGQVTANISVTNVALAHTANGAYGDVNVSGLIPATATGVVLEVMSSTGTPRLFAIRKNGSADDRYQSVTHCWITIGLDANKIFEVKEVAGGDIQIYLIGYTYGTGITLNTNANDISLAGFGAWTDIDVSAITPAGTVGIIVEVQNLTGGGGLTCGLRKNGSADARTNAITDGGHFWAYIGVDDARILEGWAQATNVNFYLVGYVTSGATFLTNAIDKSLGVAAAWTDIDCSANVTAGTNFVIMEMIAGGGGAVGLRSNSSTEDRYQNYADQHGWAVVNCDNSQIVEGKINAVTLDWFLVGYFTSGISTVAASVSATGLSSADSTLTVTGTANYPSWATGDVLHFANAANSYLDMGNIYNATGGWASLTFILDSDWSAGSGYTQYMFEKEDGAGETGIFLDLVTGTSVLRFRIVSPPNTFQIDVAAPSGDGIWHAGVAYHVLASWGQEIVGGAPSDGARLRVNNGVAQTNASHAGTPVAGNNLNVGSYRFGGATNHRVRGTIFNLAMGTDNLTAAEETALYNGTVPADATDYWYIDEGTGTAITSYGTAANPGTAGADTVWQTATYIGGQTGRLCDFWLQYGATRVGKNLKGVSVPNNGNAWTFCQNDVMPYITSIKETVGGTQVLWYQPTQMLSGATIPDRATGDGVQDGTINWGTNSYISLVAGIPTSYASTGASTTSAGFSMTDLTMPSQWFASGTGLASLPFYDLFNQTHTSTGIPTQTLYFIPIYGLALFAAILIMSKLRSAFLGVLALLIVLFIGSAQTVVPMWIPFFIMIVCFAIMYLYRQMTY